MSKYITFVVLKEHYELIWQKKKMKLFHIELNKCIKQRLCGDLMTSPSSSKLFGTKAPASFRALFLATAVSDAWLAQAPAWPNWTYEGNVPIDDVPDFAFHAAVKNGGPALSPQRKTWWRRCRCTSTPPAW